MGGTFNLIQELGLFEEPSIRQFYSLKGPLFNTKGTPTTSLVNNVMEEYQFPSQR